MKKMFVCAVTVDLMRNAPGGASGFATPLVGFVEREL
jgi:hypothetical protein